MDANDPGQPGPDNERRGQARDDVERGSPERANADAVNPEAVSPDAGSPELGNADAVNPQPGSSEGGTEPLAEETEEDAYELLQRGHALLKARHNAQAAIVLERAARIEHRKGSIIEALARAYYNSGQTARAAEAFKELIEIDPSAHYGHFGLGLSFQRLGRRKEARTHLRLAVALDPASPMYRRALERLETTLER